MLKKILFLLLLSTKVVFSQQQDTIPKNSVGFFAIPLLVYNTISISYERKVSERCMLGITFCGKAAIVSYGYVDAPVRDFSSLWDIDNLGLNPYSFAGLYLDYKYRLNQKGSRLESWLVPYTVAVHQSFDYYGEDGIYIDFKQIAMGQGIMVGSKLFLKKRNRFIEVGIGMGIAYRKMYYKVYPKAEFPSVVFLPRINIILGNKVGFAAPF